MPLLDDMAAVAAALSSRRLSVDTEARLQHDIAGALVGFDARAEVRLDPKNRIDFLVGSIGIEAKIKGSRLRVWRQLERYAEFEEIQALILVGTVAMPANIAACGGKPFRFVSIGKGWL